MEPLSICRPLGIIFYFFLWGKKYYWHKYRRVALQPYKSKPQTFVTAKMNPLFLLYKMIEHKLFPPADTQTSFSGKTVLVTGANTGLGFEAAVKFAKLGASSLVLAVRTQEKGEQAKRDILIQSGRTDPSFIHILLFDMLSYPSIQSLAKQASVLPSLDIAVVNAGIFATKHETSPYGYEKDIQVNTLSTVLLSLLLIPKMKASKTSTFTPTLEIVSSGTHKIMRLSEHDQTSSQPLTQINSPSHKWSPNFQYSASKLFLMCALPHIAKQGEGKDGRPEVVVTSCCPGFTKSDIHRDVSVWWVKPIVAAIANVLFRTTEQGARTLVSGALVGEKGHAGFWQHDLIQP